MSTWEQYEVSCPRCSTNFRAPVLKGVYASWLPEVHAAVRDGSFARCRCPACSATLQVETETVYTDFERGYYVGVASPEVAGWRAVRARHAAAFDSTITFGPPVAQELAGSLVHRVVFGAHALREKILLWDAALDDRVVEALKGDWLRTRGLRAADVVLRASDVLPGGHILFAVLEPWEPVPTDDSGITLLGMPRLLEHVSLRAELYERRLMRRSRIAGEYPALADDWLVDLHTSARSSE